MEDNWFYEMVKELPDNIQGRYFHVIIADSNAKVGRASSNEEVRHIGSYEFGERNDRWDSFMEICIGFDLVVSSKIFQH